MARVYVIGIDGSGVLSREVMDALRRSHTILSSSRLNEVFSEYSEYDELKEKIRVLNGVDETLGLLKESRDEVAVIASGDPLFYGIGGRIAQALPEEDIRIYPALSSVQLAFARLRLPWHDAYLMSLHGSVKRQWAIEDIPMLAEQHQKLAILTGGENTPERIAGLLPDDARVHVLERLGFDDEDAIVGNPSEIAGMTFRSPNCMVVLRETVESVAFGLSEDAFVHERGLVTKDETRAVVLHQLALPRQGVFWDVGAGSGSVSIEAKRISPSLDVYAVEREAARVGHIQENIAAHHVGGIHVVHGVAPEALSGLPKPDRVFIGGAGKDIRSVIKHVVEQMDKGIVVAGVITLESIAEAREEFAAHGLKAQVTSISVSRSQPIEGRDYLKALNQIFLIKAVK